MQIVLTPDKIGFVTEQQALEMGADPQQLNSLDWLNLHGRKHYRQIDIERLKTRQYDK